MVDIFLNEKYIGEVDNGDTFINKIKEERRKSILPNELNYYYEEKYNSIYLNTSKGRARRPLIIVKNGASLFKKEHIDAIDKGLLKWKDLLKEGIIEYVDAAEEENCYIALDENNLNKDHTHIEISPVAILGLCTSLVPYSNYGGSSRLIRGTKILKQSLGLYSSNFLLRMDTDVNILHYPQIPLTKTFMHDIFNYDKHPSGQNVVIAIMSYEGYNMSDAIIVNKGSVDRGFGRSTFFKPFSSEEKRYQGGLMDEFTIPDKEVKGYRAEKDYKFLEDDGVIYEGAKIKADDVLVGKVSPPRFLGEFEEFSIAANVKRESSVALKHGEKGVVDSVLLTENEEGNRLVQVRLREQRIPEVGDKFASRHGQKGVISYIVKTEDMPFTVSGIVPDILFSPFGIPSRMTISHLIEIIAGKVSALSGEFVDGTAFDVTPESDLKENLLKMGFKDDGTELMYNGITGKVYPARIYIGNIYYLKLKHMVANKLHARASGKIQLLTRQPIEGRLQGGGLRIGEMEKDCFVAHGAAMVLKERFDSDKTVIYVCEECGMWAVYDNYKDKESCPKCGSKVKISSIEVSYAFKLLIDELKALCVYPKIILGGKF